MVNPFVIIVGAGLIATAIYKMVKSEDLTNTRHNPPQPLDDGWENHKIGDLPEEVNSHEQYDDSLTIMQDGHVCCRFCKSSKEHGGKSKRVYWKKEDAKADVIRLRENKGRDLEVYLCKVLGCSHLRTKRSSKKRSVH